MCTADAARHAGAGLGDRLHHDRRLGDAEAGAAVLLGDAHAEPAVVGERARRTPAGKPPSRSLFEPVRVVEAARRSWRSRRGCLAARSLRAKFISRSEFAGDAAAACGPRTTPLAISARSPRREPPVVRISTAVLAERRRRARGFGRAIGPCHRHPHRADRAFARVLDRREETVAPRCGSASELFEVVRSGIIGHVGLLEQRHPFRGPALPKISRDLRRRFRECAASGWRGREARIVLQQSTRGRWRGRNRATACRCRPARR